MGLFFTFFFAYIWTSAILKPCDDIGYKQTAVASAARQVDDARIQAKAAHFRISGLGNAKEITELGECDDGSTVEVLIYDLRDGLMICGIVK